MSESRMSEPLTLGGLIARHHAGARESSSRDYLLQLADFADLSPFGA